MFESFENVVEKENQPPQDYDEQSRQLAGEIARLEAELQGNPANGEIQKALMLMYNRVAAHETDSLGLFPEVTVGDDR